MNTTKAFKLLRLLAGKSRKEIADACHVCTSTVHDAENRNRTLNTENGTFLNRYLQYMNVPLSAFVGISFEVKDFASALDFWEFKERHYSNESALLYQANSEDVLDRMRVFSECMKLYQKFQEYSWVNRSKRISDGYEDYIKLI